MKRWIGWMLAFAMLLMTASSFGVAANGSAFMLGDVNNDGVLDMEDAFRVYLWVSDGTVPSDKLTVADVTEDGIVDMVDAFLIFRLPVAW